MSARAFWGENEHGRDTLLAITYTLEEEMIVFDALRRGRNFVIEREHDENRYKGKFVRGWSEDDGFFWSMSREEDPGSKHREQASA